MSQTALLAVELLDAKIEDEDLDGRSEAQAVVVLADG